MCSTWINARPTKARACSIILPNRAFFFCTRLSNCCHHHFVYRRNTRNFCVIFCVRVKLLLSHALPRILNGRVSTPPACLHIPCAQLRDGIEKKKKQKEFLRRHRLFTPSVFQCGYIGDGQTCTRRHSVIRLWAKLLDVCGGRKIKRDGIYLSSPPAAPGNTTGRCDDRGPTTTTTAAAMMTATTVRKVSAPPIRVRRLRFPNPFVFARVFHFYPPGSQRVKK